MARRSYFRSINHQLPLCSHCQRNYTRREYRSNTAWPLSINSRHHNCFSALFTTTSIVRSNKKYISALRTPHAALLDRSVAPSTLWTSLDRQTHPVCIATCHFCSAKRRAVLHRRREKQPRPMRLPTGSSPRTEFPLSHKPQPPRAASTIRPTPPEGHTLRVQNMGPGLGQGQGQAKGMAWSSAEDKSMRCM